MNPGHITEREMLRRMESGEVFSLRYVSFDRQRRKGGKVKHIEQAVLLHATKEASTAARRPLTPSEHVAVTVDVNKKKDPNHPGWYTRNVRVLQDGAPTAIVRKVHPPLVLSYNEMRVLP